MAEISKSGTTTPLANPSTAQLLTMNRETIKRLLAFPADTSIVWKSHDDSIAQRSAIDQARQDKAAGNASHHHHHHGADRRRAAASDDSTGEKGKGVVS